jgi:hypothetical protein
MVIWHGGTRQGAKDLADGPGRGRIGKVGKVMVSGMEELGRAGGQGLGRRARRKGRLGR